MCEEDKKEAIFMSSINGTYYYDYISVVRKLNVDIQYKLDQVRDTGT